MAQNRTATSGRASRTAKPGSRASNTPRVSESEIGQLKVAELRDRLSERGVTGVSGLRKPELVKSLVKAIRGGKAQAPGGARKGAAKPAGTKPAGTKPAGTKAAGTKAAGTKAADTRNAKRGGGARTGGRTSRSLKYADEITAVDQQPQRPGRTLVTTNHDVIRRWAAERGAVPATVPGTGPRERPGVLRFDFPGWGGRNLQQIDWDQWFATFDERQLNFIYQQERARGGQSNFFRLENPHREDA